MQYPISYQKYLDQDRRIFTDSRQLLTDGVFVALHGKNFDGNEFAMEALDKGAAYAIVDRIEKQDPRLILVKDTLLELQAIAALNRKVNKAKVIAITGTNGKTTTKELTLSVFKNTYNSIATLGNLNNHIGVPMTLLRITGDTEFAIIEMGANRPGDIKELCMLADPDIGLITSLGKAHLEGFKTFEAVISTKMELFDYLDSLNRICVYNLCSAQIQQVIRNDKNRISFGNKGQVANFHGELIKAFPSIEMYFWDDNHAAFIESDLFGEYNYQNILGACTLATINGISSTLIKKGIKSYMPDNMRSQILKIGSNTVILDAYNANPSSMQEAINAFDSMDFPEKWVILGEMAELGEYKTQEHQKLLDLVLTKKYKLRILIGPAYEQFKNLDEILYFENAEQCKNWLSIHWPQNVALFIKGSRSASLEKLIH